MEKLNIEKEQLVNRSALAQRSENMRLTAQYIESMAKLSRLELTEMEKNDAPRN